MDRKRRESALPPDVFLHIDTPLTVAHQAELLRLAGFSQVRVLVERGSTVILRGEKTDFFPEKG